MGTILARNRLFWSKLAAGRSHPFFTRPLEAELWGVHICIQGRARAFIRFCDLDILVDG